jgi:hypothetical protein
VLCDQSNELALPFLAGKESMKPGWIENSYSLFVDSDMSPLMSSVQFGRRSADCAGSTRIEPFGRHNRSPALARLSKRL